jgi:tRNA threonylcarbamoyladenosine biosynthesis protein TsaE
MPEVWSVPSASPEETFALGERLGRMLQNGDFVGLVGELGAGKTVFARGVTKGIGAPLDEFSSPTFAIVQTYEGGRVRLHHADLYRLSDVRELEGTGFFDLRDSGGATLCEWIDKVRAAAPTEWLEVRLTDSGENARRLEARGHGPRGDALLEGWLLEP